MLWRTSREAATPSASESTLLRHLLQGDPDAMAELYRRHGGLVYRFSLRLIQDESAAEEITQEVFLCLLQHAARFDPARASLSTWLCGMARRLAWKQLRLRGKLEQWPAEDDSRQWESPGDTPAGLLLRHEALQAVERELDLLPPEQREVIVLCDLEEWSYEAVAEALGVPIGTVRSRRHRAIRRLAAALTPALPAKGKEECR